MGRRSRDAVEPAAPTGLLADYPGWCAAQGLRAYGDPLDEASMRAAVLAWEMWLAERQEWAQSHGIDVAALPVGCDEPWDADAI